ncbi:hypothetical protein ABDD95_02005 [Mucilaginibacter sp. PAMB04274]|uniref:hypothetical protein n=1 Tax=Mucilaginibacter sp. PAMB04274 TaxID=3138568 RepID=UPI0031F7028B
MKAFLSSVLFIAALENVGMAQTTVAPADSVKRTGIGPCFGSITPPGPLYIIHTKHKIYQLLSVDLLQQEEVEKMHVKTNQIENTALYGIKAQNGLVIFTLKADKESAVIKRLNKNLIKL